MRFHNSFDLHALEGDLYAPLSFTGSSKGVNGNEAEVEGFVRMGHDGVARWQLVRSLSSRSKYIYRLTSFSRRQYTMVIHSGGL